MNVIRFMNSKNLYLIQLFTFVCKITSIHANIILAIIVISVIADSTMCGILVLDPKKANGAINTIAT